MQEVIKFLKEIFMLKSEDDKKIGLAQFKTTVTPVEKAAKKPAVKAVAEVKLSDLMRRSY